MHTNVSIANGKNLFWDPKGEEKLSKLGWAFLDRILTHGNDICLLLNASVNAYRRLDPHFEAPNQIKASPVDRGSMIRIPIGNEKSMRVEVRSVAPGCKSIPGHVFDLQDRHRRRDGEDQEPASALSVICPTTSTTPLTNFRKAEWTTSSSGKDVRAAMLI